MIFKTFASKGSSIEDQRYLVKTDSEIRKFNSVSLEGAEIELLAITHDVVESKMIQRFALTKMHFGQYLRPRLRVTICWKKVAQFFIKMPKRSHCRFYNKCLK